MKMLRELVSSAAVAATAITLILASAVPAHALQDTSIGAVEKLAAGATLADQEEPSSDSMPDNPQIPLPDSISESIPDDATVVSADLAITPEGELKNIETGETVEDPGAAAAAEAGDRQPDPLAKTDGESFIPVSAETVKAAVEEVQSETSADGQGRESQSSSSSDGSIKFAKFESNSYGAHWGTCNGTKAFFDYENNLFVQQAKGVVDVSTWQGDIDWVKAKADGVEGAIIRLGYGEGNSIDTKAKRNISECKRLGIPFGIYWYSYADTGSMAKAEANDIVAKLKQVGVSAKDLTYPIYYDLEKWSGWTGHTPPTSVSAYDNIVNSWYNVMQSNGYSNLGVYSYTSYLQGPLNSANIHAKTRWVAQYGAKMGFTKFPTNDRGWQYTSIGHVDGIDGNVDMNAFGNKSYSSGGSHNSDYTVPSPALDTRQLSKVSIPNGSYYINVRSKISSSVDIPGASTANSTAIQLYAGNGSNAQRFKFTQQSDGSYEIVNVNSGKALDVRNAAAGNNAVVQQYSANGSKAQRWFIRDSGVGYYLQSALGNWVLDLSGGGTANGTAIRLYAPNGSAAQMFVVSSSDVSIPTDTAVTVSSGINKNLVLDVTNGSTVNGARIQLYGSNGTDAQCYRFQTLGNGAYRIVNANSGKVLDVSGGSNVDGAVLQQYGDNGTLAQQWTVRNYGNGKIALVSVNANKAVDVPGANAYATAKLQLYSPNGSAAQQWVVTKCRTVRECLDDKACQHRNDITDGTYTFGSKLRTSLKLDVNGASQANGGNVQLWTGNGTKAQKWKIAHDSSGYVTLTSVNSNKVLDVSGALMTNGTNVQQYAANGTYAQKWIVLKNSDGSYVIQSALSENMVLDVAGGSAANGANVQLYAANGTNAQRWQVR